MRVKTSKDKDILSRFDKINETQAENILTSLKHMLMNNHVEVDRGKNKGQLPLDHKFGFCKTFKKNTKNRGFHLTFKTADVQDII